MKSDSDFLLRPEPAAETACLHAAASSGNIRTRGPRHTQPPAFPNDFHLLQDLRTQLDLAETYVTRSVVVRNEALDAFRKGGHGPDWWEYAREFYRAEYRLGCDCRRVVRLREQIQAIEAAMGGQEVQ